MIEERRSIKGETLSKQEEGHIPRRQLDVIIDQIISGDHEDDEIFKAEKEVGIYTTELISKLYRSEKVVKSFIDKVDERFDITTQEDDREMIIDALRLVLRVHINQSDRSNNQEPYATHPIRVAMGVLDTYKGEHLADVVTAALLHDTVEDQAYLVTYLGGALDGPVGEGAAKFGATQVIEDRFGPDVAELVYMVSTTQDVVQEDFDKGVYFNFVKNIVENEDNHGPQAFAIKWQDAKQNMLGIGDLWQRSIDLRNRVRDTQLRKSEELDEEANRVQWLYKELRDEYKPVLEEIFLPAFTKMTKEHVLYNIRDEALQEIQTALANEYDKDKVIEQHGQRN